MLRTTLNVPREMKAVVRSTATFSIAIHVYGLKVTY